MRKIINFVLFIIFAIGAIVSYGYVRNLVNGASDAAVSSAPLISLVRDMTIQATPEIVPDPVTIIREVNTLARLETASFEGEKVITSERGSDGLFGLFEESIVFVAYGQVIAGIDLQQIEEGDIQVVDPTTVMVHLPEAEVFVATLDNDNSYVVDRDVGFLTNADPQLETAVRQAGEQAIFEAAMEFGILDNANENAEEYMEQFMNGLGFETVIFTDEKPPVPEPYVQEVPKGYVIATPTP
mgnify:CR=1 FL=1